MLSFPFTRYRFVFEAQEPMRLPGYTGSLWRGALGHALKKTVCLVDAVPCGVCMLASQCAYPVFFEENLPGRGTPEQKRFSSPPRPFVIEPVPGPSCLAAGDPLALDLVLLGPGEGLLPFLLQALRAAGQRGLGAERGRALLTEVRVEDQRAPSGWSSLGQAPVPERGSCPSPPPGIRMRLLTPMRLKHRGRFLTEGSFGLEIMLRNLVARVRTLELCYGDGAAELPAPPSAAVEGALLDRDLRWYDWSRWSNRQRERLKIGGLLGWLDLDTRLLAPFWPYLWLGQWLHLGNATSFGLGRYVLEANEECLDGVA
jgi:hypothetical protein